MNAMQKWKRDRRERRQNDRNLLRAILAELRVMNDRSLVNLPISDERRAVVKEGRNLR